MQDAELLREYLKSGSEAAFAELVKRYVDFVYSTARRQIGDAHLAQEVAQTVFCLLARKAAGLIGLATIAGWLYRATCFTAARTLRTEKRRRRHEQEVANMNQLDSTADGTWEHLSPMLDSALNELGEKDRLAVLLRFFQRKPMREVGEVLGVSEDAAKMRVGRAVEQLRKIFAKRGVACSPAGLGILLTEKSVEAAPTVMASNITTAVLSGAAVSTLSIIEVLIFMAKIKAKMLAVAGVGTLVVLVAGVHVYNSVRQSQVSRVDTVTAISNSENEQRNRDNQLSAQTSDVIGRVATLAPANDTIDLNDAIANLRAALRSTNSNRIPSPKVEEAIRRFGPHLRVAFDVLKEEANARDRAEERDADGSFSADWSIWEQSIRGMGFFGKSVPEAVPFLWNTYNSWISKESNSRAPDALYSLHQIGFGALGLLR